MLTFKSIFKTVSFLIPPISANRSKTTMTTISAFKYLNQEEATNLDQELFNDYRFSVDQLMELAGLSVAIAIAKAFPVAKDEQTGLHKQHPFSSIGHDSDISFLNSRLLLIQIRNRANKVLVICGPGNNGGDGLVAARHLTLFGYNSSILYPKRTPKPLYDNLLVQCTKYGVKIIDSCPDQTELDKEFNIIVDALFGFSFKPPVREEMKPILNAMINTKLPVCSVDIPSGWDVNNGPPSEPHIEPKLLISLSAPKQCATFLKDSKHFLGGRFIPRPMQEKYGLTLPDYPGTEQVVEL